MSSETALARQLKKLAVPQTTVLIQSNIRKSILYNHQDAAGLDRDLIFSYGTNGLEKLCIANPLFSRFESNLFSLRYKDFERSVQSKDDNKKLDSKIREFLRMLSPYILIKAAHEALEWLIYRFHIHMYNTDDLIASVLPHYNSSTFGRVVQLLDLNERSRWFWLKPVQKSNMHLDYSALLNRFISDGGFRKFVCDIAPNVLSVYKDGEGSRIAMPIIFFSMITIYNALYKCQEIEDKLITFLFPYILNGLSSGLSDYGAVSYLIISRIVLKVKLTPEITEELLIRVFQTVEEDLIKQAFELLLLVFQNQSIKSLPSKVHTVIISHSESLNILSYLATNFESFPLIRAIIKKTIFVLFKTSTHANAKKSKRVFKFFKQFLDYVTLNEKSSSLCFNVTLKKFSKCCKNKKLKNSPKQFKQVAKYVFRFIENRYPDHFDKVYKSLLSKSKSDKKILCKIINNSVCSTKYKMLPDMKTSLVLGLNHANAQIRQTSVSYLLELVAKNKYSDKEFIENALYDRLLDKSTNVVQTILCSPDIILEVLGKNKMITAFDGIFKRKIKLESDWYSVQMKCLDIAAKKFIKDDNLYDILPLILKFMFPLNKHTIEGFLFLLDSDIKNPFLEELKTHQKDINESKDGNTENIFHDIIIASVKSFVEKMDEVSKTNFVVFLKSKRSVSMYSFFAFYIYVLQCMITGKNLDKGFVINCIEDLLQVFEFCFCQPDIIFDKYEYDKHKDVPEQYNIKKSLESLNKNKFPTSLVYNAFHKIMAEIEIDLKHDPWPTVKSNPTYKILTSLFNFCILHLNSNKEVLKEYFTDMLSLFISRQFKTIQQKFWFLSTKWVNYAEDIPLTIQITSINFAVTLHKQQNSMNWVFDDNVLLCMLRTIANLNNSISHAALNLLSSILDCSKDFKHPLKFLSEEICAQSEEIKIDYRQIYECIGNWLKPTIEQIDSKKTTQALVEKELQNEKFVLEKFLNVLKSQEAPYTIKHFVLLCLQNANSLVILTAYIPVLDNCLQQLQQTPEHKKEILTIIELLLQKFTPKTAVCLSKNSKESKALLDCLNFTYPDEKDIETSVLTLALHVLNKEFFAAISVDIQQEILDILLKLYMESSTNINIKIEKVLRKLCTYAYLYLKHFQDKELTVSKGTTLREVKNSKHNQDNSSTFEYSKWKKMFVFLELMQNKSKLDKIDVLIPELFNLLEKSLDFDTKQKPHVEYLRQLILSAIHSCCEQLGSAKLDERQFKVEILVRCIRSSTDAKTHHLSLLLLNLAAPMFPDYVLNNAMSIFTFMGSELLKQDDSHSFQVISQTIKTIMPSLIKVSNQKTKTDGVLAVASVFRVFIDSFTDIPGHRQLPLFTKLISTLDPSKYLWIPLGQICGQYPTTFNHITADDSKISPNLEFAVNFHKQFPPDIQIDTCIELINFLASLPDTKKQLDSNPEMYEKIKGFFNKTFLLPQVNDPIDNKLQSYKCIVLSYMKIWLSSQAFLNQVFELNIKEQYCLEEKYELLLEKVLSFLQNRLNSKQTERGSEVQLLYDLVYAINSLLPCNLFLRVIRRLLKHSEKEIQMKSIELLNTKLEQQQGLILEENHKALLKLLKPLLKLVDKYIKEEPKEEKQAVIEQTALYSLHLLSKLIGSEYPTKFYKVLHVSVAILNKYTQPELIVNALLCLAQLCNCLNVDILPHLNSLMPVIVNILQDKQILHMSECLILGVIAAVQSIVEHLGMFLSSYMEAIVTGICVFSVKYSELGKKSITEKFINLQSKIASEIALRVLLTAIESSYSKLSSENANNVIPLMKILTEKLNSSTYEDILNYSPQLQKFYMCLLDFRNCNQDLPSEMTADIESSIISSLETFVMKLSITRFRTFFQKIFQWSTTRLHDKKQKCRIYTFYKMTREFSKTLKSLFSHMAKYFFRHAAMVIDSNNASKSKVQCFDENFVFSQELLLNILDTLNCCFMYSEEQLLDKENFDLLLQPLVDLIENVSDETFYQELIENHLSSCIAYFMAAVSDSALWKALNYQILLKTRHDSPKVRFGSLQVIQEVVNKMGDNYLVLLPESIPFLAEIMEDESTEVEQECQTVIVEMEKILGEPIRKYF